MSKTTIPYAMSRRGILATLGAGFGAAVTGVGWPARALAQDAASTLTYAIHLAPTNLFFDPGITPGTGAPLLIQYALHDGLIRPIRDEATGLSLAESMEEAEDGLSVTFRLREGATFHDGSAVTAEDAKFSFDRYSGANNSTIREFVSAAEVVDERTVKYVLIKPWPDFRTIFGTPASGVAWIVPKAYVEKVGDEGFKNAPIGAGPYKLANFTPGTELVLEAYDGYWRKKPEIARLVMRVIPDAVTRLAAVRNGEVDIAYGIQGDLIEEAKADPNLKVETALIPVSNFAMFASAGDPQSPWSKEPVRRAANMAIDREGINAAAYAGLGKVSASIIPHVMAYYWEPPAIAYDPEGAKALLAEAGYADGFDGGDLHASSDDEMAELVQANLAAIGIRVALRQSERAAHLEQVMQKKLTGLVLTGSGAPGNAALRLQQFAASDGTMSYLKDADLDARIEAQANERDDGKRTAELQSIQEDIAGRSLFMPILEFPFPVVTGARVGYSGVNGIPGSPYTTPYEDLTLKQP